ncbi:MAG: hypothetical protein MH825_00620 [Cyanobacteria bacterium]|nr:hypothetical protein [Cyanobacteriota bacterium]
MLQDARTVRHFQKIADRVAELWHRGYRFEEMRMYLDGYVAALRYSEVLDPLQINRLEEESIRYIYDPSNYDLAKPQPDYVD